MEFVTIDRDAVIWSTPESDRAGRDLVVLLHGHLGREGDLFQLSPYLPLDHVIAAPRGPRTEGTGYSWFDVEAARPAPLDAAADDLADWLADVSVDARTVTLFGYSQGGVLALQTLRRHPELVDEVVMLVRDAGGRSAGRRCRRRDTAPRGVLGTRHGRRAGARDRYRAHRASGC